MSFQTRHLLHSDRLTVRLALGITLLVVVPLGVGLYVLSYHHFSRTIEARRRAAELQNRILEVTLRHQMIEKDSTLITRILDEIGKQPEVQSVMILDHKGVIRFSSRPEMVEKEIPLGSPACQSCHSVNPEDRDRWIVMEGEGGEELRSVLPIENRPECHECHDAEQRLNGIMILDISLAEVQAQLREDSAWILGGTAALALLLLGGLGIVLRRLILVRLARLGRAARSIAKGDLEERAAVDGRDVITSLAEDFNNMADAVSRLITEVRGQEAQLASVMNSLDDGLVVLDRDFRVVASNLSFCRRFGSHPEALRGRRCREAIGQNLPCFPSEQDCPAAKCLSTGEVQRAVFRIDMNDGENGLVEEVYASPVVDGDGKVRQVVEIWRDISERVREEERLAEIERLVSLGALASGFSHEVSTPLASMLTCAEAVLGRIDDCRGPDGPAEEVLPAIRQSAETIRQEVHRCKRTTEQFLRFSRGIPPSIELIDLRSVVAGVVSLVGPTAREARVTIRMEGSDPVAGVRANTEVVQHVVLNLMINAIQSFDEAGGTVVVRFQAGRDVRIRVRDTGSGIPPGARKHLFEPFRSQKPQGTGLGLFLSRSFMRRFGGDVRLVESEVGSGSCFEIIFATVGKGRE